MAAHCQSPCGPAGLVRVPEAKQTEPCLMGPHRATWRPDHVRRPAARALSEPGQPLQVGPPCPPGLQGLAGPRCPAPAHQLAAEGGGPAAGGPDPVGDHRVAEADDHHRVDQVGDEGGALGQRARHDGAGGGGKGVLEEPVVQGAAGRGGWGEVGWGSGGTGDGGKRAQPRELRTAAQPCAMRMARRGCAQWLLSQALAWAAHLHPCQPRPRSLTSGPGP